MNDQEMLRWDRGRETIDDLLKRRELQRVPADRDAASRLLRAAGTHLVSAAQIRASDPTMAVAVAYDSARKALAALLEVQGLRATSQGGHVALRDAATVQFGGLPGRSRCDRSTGSVAGGTRSSIWKPRSTLTKRRRLTIVPVRFSRSREN